MNKNQLDVMDILNIMSFWIGLRNLDENISQNDISDMINSAIEDIHKHLQEQDERLERIEVLLYDKNKEIS